MKFIFLLLLAAAFSVMANDAPNVGCIWTSKKSMCIVQLSPEKGKPVLCTLATEAYLEDGQIVILDKTLLLSPAQKETTVFVPETSAIVKTEAVAECR